MGVRNAGEEQAYDVFVSFTPSDGPWVRGYLLAAFQQAGVRYLSEDEFPLGSARVLEIDRAARRCPRLVVVLSPAYLTDTHTQFVDLLFQTEGLRNDAWTVIPVLLHPVVLPPRLGALTKVSATDPAEWEDAVGRLCREMSREVRGADAAPPCPYPGMRPFGRGEHRRFFGRETEIEDLLARVRLGSQRCLTVIGASGSGKSSLVHAGLIPKLVPAVGGAQGGWDVRSIRPGDKPMDALRRAFGAADPTAAARSWVEESDPGSRLLLVVDQLEELFSVARSGVEEFQRTLLDLLTMPRCMVVTTARADFYPQLMSSLLWPVVQGSRVELVPVGGAALARAIVQPAHGVGVHVEAALVERLVADAAGEPGTLPLIQETLVLLWGRLRRRLLPRSAYDELIASDGAGHGGRTGLHMALHLRADGAMASLGGLTDGEPVAKRVLLRLVQFGEGRADVRRQQPITALAGASGDPELLRKVLAALAEHGLVTLSAAGDGRPPSVDISHEALIRSWPALRSWIDQRRAAERQRRVLMDKVGEWEQRDRRGGLLDEVGISEARRWKDSAEAVELGVDPALDDLVEASQRSLDTARREREAARQRELDAARELAAEQERRADAERRRVRSLRRLAVALLVLGLLAVSGVVVALVQRRDAQRAANAARAGELSFAARTLAGTDLDAAVLMSQVAEDLSPSGRTRSGLLSVLQAHTGIVRSFQGQTGVLGSLAATRDGRVVAAGGDDRSVTLWDATTGRALGPPLRLPSAVRGIAFDPRGELVAVGSRDGFVRIWEVSTGTRVGPDLHTITGGLRDVAWSPDGRLVAAGGVDRTVVLWEAGSWRQRQVLTGLAGPVQRLAFSPDGRRLAAAAGQPTNIGERNGHLAVYDLESGRMVLAPIRAGEQTVRGVAFDATGTLLAAASEDHLVYLFDAADGSTVATLSGHRARVYDVAFSPDGRTLASASRDRSVRVWDVAGRRPAAAPLVASTDPAVAVEFLPDGTVLASTAGHEVIQWTLQPRPRLARPVAGQGGAAGVIRTTAFSPDGRLLATGDYDERIFLRDGGTGELTRPSPLPAGDPVSAVAFTPDGRGLFSATYGGHIRHWDVGTHAPRTQDVYTGQGQVFGLAVDPGGRTVATAGEDGSVRLWDSTTLKLVDQPLAGHEAPVQAVAYSPDGNNLATVGDDGRVILWDVDQPVPVGWQLGRVGTPTSVAFSLDGHRLVVGTDDGLVAVWKTDPPFPGGPETQVATQQLRVKAVAFSPDGGTVASAGDDGTVALLDLRKNDLQLLGAPLKQGGRAVLGLAFRGDGTLLASVGGDGLAFWDVDQDSWRRLGCEIAGRNPSPAELEAWLGGSEHREICPGLPTVDYDAPRMPN